MLGQPGEDRRSPSMPAHGQCLGDSQVWVCEEFLMASSGNFVFVLSVVSSPPPLFFFLSSLGGQGWALSPNVTKPTLGPGRAGKNNHVY